MDSPFPDEKPDDPISPEKPTSTFRFSYPIEEIKRMMADDDARPIPEEEIQRRIAEGGTTLDEFWREMGVR